jgi:KRAB domain-containing zinc finger protein
MQRHTQLRIFHCDVAGCTYSAKVPIDLYIHKKNVHNSILYTCLLCGKNFKTHSVYKLHVGKHNTETPGVFKCLHQKCKKLVKNFSDLQKHIKEAHEEVKKFQCNECNKFYISKEMLARHIVVHWDWRPFKCDTPGCSYSCKKSNLLLMHKRSVHTLIRFTCCHCGSTLKRRFRFIQHLKKHKTDTPGVLKCLHRGCPKTFSASKDLMVHMKQHRMNACDFAGCHFTSQYNIDLQTHKRTAHSIWSHNCQLCGKGFKNSCHLKMHLKCHETGEPGVIKCTEINCRQKFNSVTDLKKHLEKHKSLFLQQIECKLNDNASECHLCGKIIKTQFLVHVLKHKTDTPDVIKCIYRGCKQTFNSATDLKVHFVKHWDVSLRPFACDFPQCNFASTNKFGLVDHKRIMHSPNLYTCDMCGKQFKNLIYIGRHITNYHLRQLISENPKATAQTTKSAEEPQELVCKDEIEEVIFD